MRPVTWLGGFRVLACALVLATGLLSRSAEAADAPPHPAALDKLPADARVMQTQTLFDPMTGKDAYSVLVPDGWKLLGRVNWPAVGPPIANCDMQVGDAAQGAAWRHLPRLQYVAGLREARIRETPSMTATWEKRWAEGQITPSGAEVRKLPASPREYVEKLLVPKLIPEVAAAKDVSVVSETDLPDLAKSLAEKDPFHRETKVSRIRMTYTSAIGPAEREFVATLVIGKTDPEGLTLWIGDVTSCRAPKGKLDALMPTFAAIDSSESMQLPWFNIQTQVFQSFMKNQAEINAKILADQAHAIEIRMAIMRDYARASSERVSEEIRTRFGEQQVAKADAHAQFMHYVNNTASYTNPNDGSPVTLAAGYNFQYMDNHGRFIQTNDPTYQPPVDPGTSWTRMEKAK